MTSDRKFTVNSVAHNLGEGFSAGPVVSKGFAVLRYLGGREGLVAGEVTIRVGVNGNGGRERIIVPVMGMIGPTKGQRSAGKVGLLEEADQEARELLISLRDPDRVNPRLASVHVASPTNTRLFGSRAQVPGNVAVPVGAEDVLVAVQWDSRGADGRGWTPTFYIPHSSASKSHILSVDIPKGKCACKVSMEDLWKPEQKEAIRDGRALTYRVLIVYERPFGQLIYRRDMLSLSVGTDYMFEGLPCGYCDMICLASNASRTQTLASHHEVLLRSGSVGSIRLASPVLGPGRIEGALTTGKAVDGTSLLVMLRKTDTPDVRWVNVIDIGVSDVWVMADVTHKATSYVLDSVPPGEYVLTGVQLSQKDGVWGGMPIAQYSELVVISGQSQVVRDLRLR